MTSGFNVFVPKKDIVYVDISVEDAFQYILTAGGVMPGADIKENLKRCQEVEMKIKEDLEASEAQKSEIWKDKKA